jgi:hypothetical protein
MIVADVVLPRTWQAGGLLLQLYCALSGAHVLCCPTCCSLQLIAAAMFEPFLCRIQAASR